MITTSGVLKRQASAIQGMDRANSKAEAVLIDSNATFLELANAKVDVRLASSEGTNARVEADLYKRKNPSQFDGQITKNNEFINQRRRQSFDIMNKIDKRIESDATPNSEQVAFDGDNAIAGDIAENAIVSAGEIVDNDSLARADGAGTQTPFPSHLDSTTAGETVIESNADSIQTSPFGTIGADTVTPSILLGGPAPQDDASDTQDDTFTTSANGGVQTAKAFYSPFEPSDNPINKYAQMTYNIGLYLQTPEQYRELITSQNKVTQGLKKILESGGSNAAEDTIFPDLFIDELEINGLFAEGNSSPHNATTMSFKIIEPMGYTFFQKLRKLCFSNGMKNFEKQHYLMVIKYKGYDENGNQLTADEDDRLSKFIPFVFSTITTRVQTGAVTYDCQAVAINHEVGLSSKRATIPFNVEILGQTLGDMFNATSDAGRGPRATPATTSQTTATSPFGTIQTTVTPGILKSLGGVKQSKGIVDALNKLQKKLAKEAGYEHADQYKVTFTGGIGSQKIISSDALQSVKDSKPMSPSVSASAQSLLDSNLSYDKTRQIYSIPAGTMMQQVLDIMVRSSEYITKQQTHIIDPKTNKVKPNPAQNKFLQWYHISVKALPIAWDNKRGDYAYDIEYIVSPKQVIDTYSPYFPKAKIRGVHKSYNYWFTGENTEILGYEQDINSTFFVAMDGSIPQEKQDTTEDSQRITTKGYVNMSDTGNKGQPGNNASPAEQAANVLYSTVDFATFSMDIVGDPDYVQQNDILYNSGNTFEPFMPDGSINYDSQEVLIEVNFKSMEDYNEDGTAQLIEPTFTDGTKETKGLIYKLTEIISFFKNGKMTQSIKGILREFDQDGNQEQVDDGREEQPFTGPTRGGMNMAGGNAITGITQTIGPDFTPIRVEGNQVPGDRAITQGIDIGPDIGTPIRPAQNGQGQFDTAGPIGPNLGQVIDNGNSVPGRNAITGDTFGVDLGQGRGQSRPTITRGPNGEFLDENGNSVLIDESGNIVDE